jgi:Ca2+-binding EF-hand superfamily protein
MVAGKGTRDISGPEGATTEEFIASVSKYLDSTVPIDTLPEFVPKAEPKKTLDLKLVKDLFERLDKDHDGNINFDEFADALVRLNVQPKTIEEDNDREEREEREREDRK